MVILVGESRVYRFPTQTIACEIYEGFAEILVLPDRRRFILRLQQDDIERLRDAFPQRTLQYIVAWHVADELRRGYLKVDEEVSA
jgi:hypothetical protein